MSKNRYVNTKFWSDNYISELDPLERYLFLYFLTNEHTNIAGIYELPMKTMAFETGLDKEMLEKMLLRFDGKIYYIDGWIYIKNFPKHQKINESIKISMEKTIKELPQNIFVKINDIVAGCDTGDGRVDTLVYIFNLIKSKSNLIKSKSNLIKSKEKKTPISPFPDDEKLSMKERHQTKKYSKMKKEEKIINELFVFWNLLKIVEHIKLRKNMESGIRARLKEYTFEQIKQSMKNYAYIINNDDYYFDYKWSLEEFLSRGEGKNIEKFLDLERAKQNFAKNKNRSSGHAGVVIE